MRERLLAALALLLAAAPAAAVQERAPEPGARVRVTLVPGTWLPRAMRVDREVALRWQAPSADRLLVKGTWLGADADSVRIDPEGGLEAFAVPRESLVRLERHAGRRRHTGIFALAFGAPSAAVGALGGAAFCSGDYYCDEGTALNALKWGAILGAGGALLGAGIGTAVTSDRWEALDPPLVVAPVPIEGRIGAAISMRF